MADRFTEGFNPETGERRTRIGDVRKTHVPQLEGLIVEITLPDTFERRDTKGGRGGGIPYQEYRFPINDGFVLANSFLGERAAGQTVTAKVKIGRKEVRKRGRDPFFVYYLKIEPTDQPVDHRLQIAPHDLALEDMVQAAGGDAVVFELKELNKHHQGGIIVVPL